MKEQFVYILESEKDGRLYIGVTDEIKKRLYYHNKGKVRSTKGRRPLKLVYVEKANNRTEALKREKYLKDLKNSVIIRNYIMSNSVDKVLADAR